MVVYKWLSTHGSYKGLLMLLENAVNVCVEVICDMYI